MIAFVLAGATSNVGKTTVSSLLMYAYKAKGYRVQAFKCGPDFLDPTFHEAVTGRPSYNLDLHLMGEAGIVDTFNRYTADADVAIVEGVMGMYDGAGHDLDNGSAANISRILGIPLILLVDGKGVSTSLAAQVKGYCELDPRVDLRGVLINRTSSAMLYELLKDAVQKYTAVDPVGFIPLVEAAALQNRHLGLLPSAEVDDLDQKLAALYGAAEATIDYCKIGEICQVARNAVAPLGEFAGETVTMAIARDAAFYFYYRENIAMMEARGIVFKPFSPLHDSAVPSGVQGIYIGGGYPELHLAALAENSAMRKSIKSCADAGMPIYAECGGLMYLSSQIVDMAGDAYPMVGVFPGSAEMTKRLQHFGYVNVELSGDTVLGAAGTSFTGHEFHRSKTAFGDAPLRYNVAKAYRSNKQWQCGAVYKNVLAAYTHVHFKRYGFLIDRLIDNMKAWQAWQNQ